MGWMGAEISLSQDFYSILLMYRWGLKKRNFVLNRTKFLY